VSEDWRVGGFGVYVHWPFCLAKCPYCDFNSHVRGGIDEGRWRRALVDQVADAARQVPGRVVNSIFFGGGTPSLMPPETVAAVIAAIRTGWQLADGLEITLEANPTSVEAGRFRAFRDAGVNRISMGIQALNDDALRRLGRMHNVAEAIEAFEIARATFERVSFDLIYARQGQSLAQWREELGRAISLAVDHLSLYQLTIETGTRFGDLHARGRLRDLPDQELSADMYALTQEVCDAAGMGGYEISNHARPGAESRHNLIYWRYGDYAGIGPGAHGRLSIGGSRWAVESTRSPEAWLGAVETKATGPNMRSEIDGLDQGSEMLMMGLRLREGIDLDRYEHLAGRELSETLLSNLSEIGLLARSGNRISTTASGRIVLDSVLKVLINQ